MSQNALNFAIEHAFQALAAQSMELFDAWYEYMHVVIETHYIFHSEIIESKWNATNLDLMLACAMPPA